jgi:phosphoenolpyruvate synthase/pyruvate phosphate dikinase
MEQIKWLHEVRTADADDVGDDAASLGELLASGLRVADGFVVVADALRQVVGSDPAACTSAQLVGAYRQVDRSTNEVVQTRLAAKDAEVVVRGGVATAIALSAERRHTHVLTDEQAAQIARVALAVEDCLGGPQVVDWALGTDGEVLVRAARPLTMAPEG